jgi:histidine ammonia-lyase
MAQSRNPSETARGSGSGPSPRLRHVSEPGLSSADVAAYATDPTVVDVVLGTAHLDAVRRGQADLEAARAKGKVYGLTTGVGALRHLTIETEGPGIEVVDRGSAHNHAMRLWRSHAGGLGPVLDDGLARATMLVRLHQLLRGGSGVGPDLVVGLARALEADAVPSLHSYGGIGTGDLTVLAQLGLTLVGDLPWHSGTLDAVKIADGDALPFMSSNALTIAIGSVAITRLARLARAAEQVAALSHLGLRGSVEAYDPRVHDGKNDPHAGAVAARLWDLLEGGNPRSRVQDPFGLRALPQVQGPLEETLTRADLALTAEIGAAAENPLTVDGGEALHHGQFLTQRLAVILDAVRAATVPVLTLSTARLGSLLDPQLTDLPPFLAKGPVGSSGLMITEYLAADLLGRARALAWPVTGTRTQVSLGLEEHASHSTQSAWSCLALLEVVPDLLACELAAAVRCLRLAPERFITPACRDLFDQADMVLPDVRGDHVVGPELAAAADLVRRL